MHHHRKMIVTTRRLQQVHRKKLQQQGLAEREASPSRANLALAKLFLGGQHSQTDLLRAYSSIITKHATALKLSKLGKRKGGKGANVVEGNLLATASNNLAVLHDRKESVFNVVKRIPTASVLSVSEDHANVGGRDENKGNSATSSASMAPPLVGTHTKKKIPVPTNFFITL